MLASPIDAERTFLIPWQYLGVWKIKDLGLIFVFLVRKVLAESRTLGNVPSTSGAQVCCSRFSPNQEPKDLLPLASHQLLEGHMPFSRQLAHPHWSTFSLSCNGGYMMEYERLVSQIVEVIEGTERGQQAFCFEFSFLGEVWPSSS